MHHLYIFVIAVVLAGMSAPIARAASPENAASATQLKNAPLVISERDLAEMSRAKTALAKNGYVEHLTRVSLAEYALQRIREKEQQAEQALQAPAAEGSGAAGQGFFRLGAEVAPQFAFAPSKVPMEMVRADSKNYIIPASGTVTQVFSNTQLGQLLVREVKNAQLFVDSADAASARIGGYPVYVTTVKYAGGQWATFILASKDRRVLEIEVGVRVTTPQQKAALDALVASLLSSS